MLLHCGVGEDSWESLGLQGDPTSPSWRRSVLGVHWKDWCWSWNSSTVATWCEELTHWKRPWCWEGLGAGGEGDAEDEMVEWHHRLDGNECEQTPGVSEGQGSLVCHRPWGHKELDRTEWWNNIQQPQICIQDEPLFFHGLRCLDWPLLSRIYTQKEPRYHLLNVLKMHNALFKMVIYRLSLSKISSLNYQPHTWAVAICREAP